MVADHDLPAFGYLPFDGYVVANWDPNSSLSKKQQQRSLVESWIRLGKYGRNEYQEFMDPPDEFPPHVPQDLLTDEDRSFDAHFIGAFWIRTWFGRKGDRASQDAADEAYKRLRILAIQDGDEDGTDYCLEPELLFENKAEFGPDSITALDKNDGNPDIIDGIACGTPGSIPAYLLTALMHYPDVLDGTSDSKWRHFSGSEAEAELPNVDKRQNLMVSVADRKACEEGWVLHFAVNHRGKILPFRLRDRASWASQWIANWMDGQSLKENTTDPDEEVEFYMHDCVDGWGP